MVTIDNNLYIIYLKVDLKWSHPREAMVIM